LADADGVIRRGLSIHRRNAAGLASGAVLAICLALPTPGAGAPGDLDAGFGGGGGGLVLAQLARGGEHPASHVAGVAQAPDGALVTAGLAIDSLGHPAFGLARYSAGGARDASFGEAGRVVVQLGKGERPYSRPSAVAVAPDGAILVAGVANEAVAQDVFAVARFTPAGALDESFGSGGVATVKVGTGVSQAASMALAPDGGILVVGQADDAAGAPAAAVVRLLGNGLVDEAYGGQGAVLLQLGLGRNPFSIASAAALDAAGRLALVGTASDPDSDEQIVVARLGPTGAPDPAFGGGGAARVQLGLGKSPLSAGRAIALHPDGGVLVAGTATGSLLDERLAVARYTTDGRLDRSFGRRGRAVLQVGIGDSELSGASAIATDPLGRLLVAGEATDTFGDRASIVMRLGPNGALDPSFGSRGVARGQFGLPRRGHRFSVARALLATPSGGAIVAGDATDREENEQTFLARYQGGARKVAAASADDAPVRGGVARISLACGAPPGARCSGRLRLMVGGRGSGASGRTAPSLGSANFSVPAFQARLVSVRLSAAGRALLRRNRRLSASARGVIFTPEGSSVTVTRLRLVLERQRRS
jgi:uncharacterized delta-60 repeat protein